MTEPKLAFRTPPLVEVSFGLFFEQVAGMSSAHFGRFWSTIAGTFPETQDQLMVGLPKGVAGNLFPLPRVWFVHKDRALLIQLQTDRFYLNWRRIPGGEYPRFGQMLPLFSDYVNRWRKFVDESGIGPLHINKCELTYVNHIFEGEGWSGVSQISNVLSPSLVVPPQGRLPDPVGLAWQSTYQIGDCDVVAEVKTATLVEDQQKKLLQLELKAQSKSKIDALLECEKWLAGANLVLEDVFLAMTTKTAQEDNWHRVRS